MEKTSNSQKVFVGLFWKFGERICAQGISFIVSIVLARILLPCEYGAVSLIMIFITIANVFVTSGLSSALIQKKDANETDFSTVFYCTVFMSVILYIILFIASKYIAEFYKMPELNWYLRIFSIKILISAYNSIQHAYVSRNMLFKKFFFSTIIGTIISGVVGIAMAFAGFGPWAIIAQYLSNSLIDTIVLNFTIPWHPKLLFSKKSAKSLVGFGWKVLMTDLLGTIFDNLRSLLIGKFYTSSDLAYYNKGQQFPQLIGNNIDNSIITVLYPAMSNSSDNPKRIKEMTRRTMKITSFVIFPLMAGLIAIAKPLITLLLTEKWNDCVIFLQILCISQAMSTISKSNLQAMKALGRSDVTLKLELIKKPIYLIILLVSIKYGVEAIAISMMVYSIVGTIINMNPNKKLLDYSFKEQIMDLLPSIILSTIMCFLVMLVSKLNFPIIVILIIQVIFGLVIYIGLSKIFKLESFQYLVDFFKNFLNRRKHGKKNLESY